MTAGQPPHERDLTDIRNLKMARSAHAYVRGNTVKFYEWLNNLKSGKLPEGPAIWICGDCHVGNLGPVANAAEKIAVQIRDLDQTVIGNPVHDLIRLGVSLASAARGLDLSGVTIARMIEQLAEGYQQAFDPDWDNETTEELPKPIRIVLKKSAARTWTQLARDRIEDEKPTIPLGKKFWPLEESERQEIDLLFASDRMKQLATALRCRDNDAKVQVIDAAYWVKGCSSLGLKRYAVLLSIGEKSKDAEFCLMDIKEAAKAAAPQYPGQTVPRDQAERIVEGARHLSPYLGKRMAAASLANRSVFIRELLPQDLKVEISELTAEDAMRTARFLANVVGRAHGRQMNATTRRDWQNELQKSHTKTLDAPSWLWSAIVELLMIHEGGYLEHCRKYAMKVGG
jgi:uncharacterized protein (DUF2252 family)